MCIATDRTIEQARARSSNEACEQCGVPLIRHVTLEDTGIELLHGSKNTIVEMGDIILRFESEMNAAFFATRPFYNDPKTMPRSQAILASGFVGKTVEQVAKKLDDYYGEAVSRLLVIVRQRANKVDLQPDAKVEVPAVYIPEA